MKDYIEREALLQDIKETVVYTARPDRENLIGRGVRLVLDRIAAAPAADVAPVVRCRDCKYYETHEPIHKLVCERSEGYLIPMKPDDFCSHGRRKEGAE